MDPGKMAHGASRTTGKRADGGKRAASALSAEEMAFRVTRPQLVAVAILSVLALVAGLLFSASYANLGIGARDVDGAVMPPGMIMTRDMPAAAMRDMAAVDPRDVTYQASPDARGDQPLEPRMEGDVKVFDLEASSSAGTSCPTSACSPTPSTTRSPARASA